MLNNRISLINDSLFYKGKAWGEEFQVAYNMADFSQLPPIRIDMEQYVIRSIDEVKHMEDAGGSEAFRQKELEYLEFERKIIQENFIRFESFTDTVSPAEMQSAYHALSRSADDEQRLLSELKTLQEAYAAKNDFVLKERGIR